MIGPVPVEHRKDWHDLGIHSCFPNANIKHLHVFSCVIPAASYSACHLYDFLSSYLTIPGMFYRFKEARSHLQLFCHSNDFLFSVFLPLKAWSAP
ncbi:uncharacterized protein BT62DRAFT_476637 [Guyanagaster necrorhizus]|uniref:Uncharacterized protein n=1 Tax=Guyanagaster necrorhizus TaxID=856835 RepID=A0A9P7VKH5_9AGAR|nr:uncharacterized protein BT62DRAFT_476637 [Guyanagaster necrorhizus MCA 3950]KAG7441626.1 hypothetical protein BT62DRAFT_476637 [Guyanagaster necrorhizus MCA 3950]